MYTSAFVAPTPLPRVPNSATAPAVARRPTLTAARDGPPGPGAGADRGAARPVTRRDALRLAAAAAGLTPLLGRGARPARAINGLHVFPLQEPLVNTYYLMRACETHSDAALQTVTNPVDKLSLDKHGLTPSGAAAAVRAADALRAAGVTSNAWVWPSVTISAFETAEVVASRLEVRRDHIVPEYSFLDARGVGALDGLPTRDVEAALRRGDATDAAWRPAPNDDGTPNDSPLDVWVRVRQLISKLETQYFAADVLVVAPDSHCLSVWQAAVSRPDGDLRAHTELAFRPGEVRRVAPVVCDAFGQVVTAPDVRRVFRPA